MVNVIALCALVKAGNNATNGHWPVPLNVSVLRVITATIGLLPMSISISHRYFLALQVKIAIIRFRVKRVRMLRRVSFPLERRTNCNCVTDKCIPFTLRRTWIYFVPLKLRRQEMAVEIMCSRLMHTPEIILEEFYYFKSKQIFAIKALFSILLISCMHLQEIE